MSEVGGENPAKLIPGYRYKNHYGECELEISAHRPGSIQLVGAWPDSLADVCQKLRPICGGSPENKPGSCIQASGVLTTCLSPGQFLILADADSLEVQLRESFSTSEATIVDLGHSRTGFRLSGSKVRPLLAKGLAVDLDESVFPTLSSVQTTIDHVGALVVRLNRELFDIFVPSSFGRSFAHWLLDAALEFGYAVGEPATLQLSVETNAPSRKSKNRAAAGNADSGNPDGGTADST